MNHWITLSVWRRPTFNKFLKWGESIVDVKPISEVGIKVEYTRKGVITMTPKSSSLLDSYMMYTLIQGMGKVQDISLMGVSAWVCQRH